MVRPNWLQIAGSGTPVGGGGSVATPGAVSIVSATAVDGTPDASGNPRKQVTVVYTPPTPLGTFAGVWVYLDAPDSSGGLSIADGTVPADGTVGAGGTFQPSPEGFFAYTAANTQIVFLAPGPPSAQQWRVYLVAGSANAIGVPVEAGLPGASPSFQLTVLAPATKASGREFAPLIQNAALAPAQAGWNANPAIAIASSGDQYFEYAIQWNWPTGDQNAQSLAGVNLVLSDGAAQTYIGNAPVGGAGAGTASTPVYVSPHLPVRQGTVNYILYLISYDVNGNSNTLVPGVTPAVQFSITRNLGPAGEEYCALVFSDGNPFVAVTPTTGADGTQLLEIDGHWAQPTDAQFGGAEVVVLKNDGKYYTVVAGRLSPVQAFITQPASVLNWCFFLRSVDINGQRNSITPQMKITDSTGSGAVGVFTVSSGTISSGLMLTGGSGYTAPTITAVDGQGNALPGVSLTPVLSGGAITGVTVGAGGSNIIATPSLFTAVGSATGVLNLAASAAGTFNSSQFTISGSVFQINAINANLITTGLLQVGGGGSKVSQMKIFDTLNNLIGFIGDDTGGSGYVGSWFKQARIGGSSPSSAPFQADTSGNVTITNATVTCTTSSVVTTLNNTTVGSFVFGALVSDPGSPGAGTFRSGLAKQGLYGYYGSTLALNAFVNGSGNGTFLGINTTNGAQVELNSDGASGAGFYTFGVSGTSILTDSELLMTALPSSSPGAGTKKFWYDPATGNVKYAA